MATKTTDTSPEMVDEIPGIGKKLKSRDLMKASEALKILQHCVGGRPVAKALLIDLISDGELTAYARYHWTTTKKGIKATWKAGPPEEAIRRSTMKSSVFAGSSLLDEDRKKWRWNRNRFHVTHVKTGSKILRYFYKGVRFERASIIALVSEAKEANRKFYQGGRDYEKDRWGEFWIQVVLLARSGQLDSELKGAKKFHSAVYNAYVASAPEEPLEYNTLAVPLRKVRKAIHAAALQVAASDPSSSEPR